MKNVDVKTLIIPAAGNGTRMLPITRVVPKEMLPIIDKPVSYYLVHEAYQSGIRHIIFIINQQKSIIEEFFSDSKGKSALDEFPDLSFSFIKVKSTFGDGHSVLLARDYIKEGEFFAVTMGDLLAPLNTPFLDQLASVHKKNNESIISVERVPKDQVDRYGVIKIESPDGKVYKVAGIIEKPSVKEAPSDLAMTGKYILHSDIFDYLKQLLNKRQEGKETKLADALNAYAKERPLYALECHGKIVDTGIKSGFLKAKILFALEHPEIGKEIKEFLESLRPFK